MGHPCCGCVSHQYPQQDAGWMSGAISGTNGTLPDRRARNRAAVPHPCAALVQGPRLSRMGSATLSHVVLRRALLLR